MTVQELLSQLGVTDFTGISDDELEYEVLSEDARSDRDQETTGVEWRHPEQRVVIETR